MWCKATDALTIKVALHLTMIPGGTETAGCLSRNAADRFAFLKIFHIIAPLFRPVRLRTEPTSHQRRKDAIKYQWDGISGVVLLSMSCADFLRKRLFVKIFDTILFYRLAEINADA